MTENQLIVKMQNVSKRFGKTMAIDGVDLSITAGQIIGLIGANGSGKSTLLRHIIGLYLPDAGCCTTFGCDSGQLGAKELARIGYVHQEGELLDWMTAGQLIRFVSAYYPNWNTELEQEYTRDFDIPLDQRVGTLSPGVRQKLAILLAIGFDPELLILDEPASGLDPIARGRFLDLLLGIIQDSSKTIIISSHILSDIEKVIDHVIIMDKGRIVRNGGFDELREQYTRIQLTALHGELPDSLPFERIVEMRRNGRQANLIVKNISKADLQQQADAIGCGLECGHLSLEELYRIEVTYNNPASHRYAEGIVL